MKKILLLISLFLLTGCTQGESAPNYEETKKMVLDTLQTEDGKKTLQKLFSDQEFQQLLVLENSLVISTIEKNMWSEDAEKFWKSTFQDPLFTESFAKRLKEQQKDIMKTLMNDPSYQDQLKSFFSQPEMEKELADIFKSASVRKELQKIVEETIQNPLLQSKWQKLIIESGKLEEGEKKKKESDK